MRVLAIVHGYPPKHNAGAEWMLHEQLRYLVEKGHECEVASEGEYEFEGVKVSSLKREMIDRADMVISHLKKAGQSLNICEFYKKPFIFLAHNSNRYTILAAKHKKDKPWIYVICNSEYIKEDMKYPNPSIVCHPHVDSKRYKTKRGQKITLINLFERKGAGLFHQLAELLPEYQFLGVEGGYGKQEKVNKPNVEYMGNTPDAKKIYAKTRILLMPSMYESYGRTGIEAMCSGIPVIASPTPGLKESLGDAGIFCKKPKEWVDAIKRLDDEVEYKKQSELCQKHAKEVEQKTLKELSQLEKFLQKVLK